MLPEMSSGVRRAFSAQCLFWIAVLAVAAFSIPAAPAFGQQQCPFTTCGDGTDGKLDYTGQSGTVYFDPVALGLHGTGDAFCVYNFTSIAIPAGLTVLLSSYKLNCPVYWLSQGDVNIAGTLSVAGGPGAPVTMLSSVRIPAAPGSGGFTGGVGGNSSTNQNATGGSGPGGGAPDLVGGSGNGGNYTANSFLVPLIGGSGGGGCTASGLFGAGGGAAGGGAILIASSTQVIVSGTVTADGGSGVSNIQASDGGSGGAIRLVSITISGSGFISADGFTYSGGATSLAPAAGVSAWRLPL
ncbi:MAG TPA: hypothetical protein VIX19_03550 [Terriglobales bacterium]